MPKKESRIYWNFPKHILLLLLFLFLAIIFWAPNIAKAQESSFKVHIGRPALGETYYYGPTSLSYNIPISGWVTGYGSNPNDIEIKMVLLQNEVVFSSETRNLLEDGTFLFYANVNPYSSKGFFPPEAGACAFSCHNDAKINLPSGEISIRIEATHSNGERVTSEVDFYIDRSENTPTLVEVVHANDPEVVLEGIPVQASTWLYLWRSRSSLGMTDMEGKALLNLETLSRASTEYQFMIEPVVVNGTYFESVDDINVIFYPGKEITSAIRLVVTSKVGSISGALNYSTLIENQLSSVTVIRLSNGVHYQSELSSREEFSFPELPIDQYILLLDNNELNLNGLYSKPIKIDLIENFQYYLDIPVAPIPEKQLHGIIQDLQGKWLPFAGLHLDESSRFETVNPENGRFSLSGLSKSSVEFYATSPGYYSQYINEDLGENLGNIKTIQLKPQPLTQTIIWGNGEIVLPAETLAEAKDHFVRLDNGWLWGKGGDEQAFSIRTETYEIEIQNGQFAIEILPNQREWFYLVEGEAHLRNIHTNQELILQPGRMINLAKNQESPPLPLIPDIVSVLSPIYSAPLVVKLRPTVFSQIQNEVTQFGIGIGQVITFITYVTGILFIIVAPILLIYQRRTKKL